MNSHGDSVPTHTSSLILQRAGCQADPWLLPAWVNNQPGRNSKHAAPPAASAVNEAALITCTRYRLVHDNCSGLPFLPFAPGLKDESDPPEKDSTGIDTGRGLPADRPHTADVKMTL